MQVFLRYTYGVLKFQKPQMGLEKLLCDKIRYFSKNADIYLLYKINDMK
jgi:hypothetical protein